MKKLKSNTEDKSLGNQAGILGYLIAEMKAL